MLAKDLSTVEVSAQDFNSAAFQGFKEYILSLADPQRQESELRCLLDFRKRYARKAPPKEQQEYEKRKRKYGAESYSDDHPSSELAQILERLDSGQSRDEDWNWLRHHRLSQAARECAVQRALHLEGLYRTWGNLWECARSSSWWRKAVQPQRAVDMTSYAVDRVAKEGTQPFFGPQDKAFAAVLTSRGGSFRDLGNLVEAEKCGLDAIEVNPESFHPYMLLGAICYQWGHFEKGDEYFSMAEARKAPREDLEAEIYSILQQLERNAQRQLASHLLGKDPVRFASVRRYVED